MLNYNLTLYFHLINMTDQKSYDKPPEHIISAPGLCNRCDKSRGFVLRGYYNDDNHFLCEHCLYNLHITENFHYKSMKFFLDQFGYNKTNEIEQLKAKIVSLEDKLEKLVEFIQYVPGIGTEYIKAKESFETLVLERTEK